tara:strand:+ start:75 stop:821 length:747 start_codon:yes stop_codon:yes gene_type:complete
VNQYFIIINSRTLLTFIISLIVPFFAYKLNISYNIDLTLISIAIIFPVVFTVRGAFRRREKALEHISRFRGSMLTLENLFDENTKMEDDKKKIIAKILIDTSDKLVDHLSKNDYNTTELDKTSGQIYLFVKTNGEFFANGRKEKILRFLRDVNESIENLIAIHSHRTPISLKAYCKIFIYMFPFIYTPTIIERIGFDAPSWITYFIVILSTFILISLYNIQDQMEYPFDKDGLDDIRLDEFKLDRNRK